MKTRENANRHRLSERRAIVRFLRTIANYAYSFEAFDGMPAARDFQRAAARWANAIESGAHTR